MAGNELEMKRPKHRPSSSVHIKSLYKRSSKRGSDGGAFTFVPWISSASNETDLFSLPEKSADFCECSLAQEAFVKIIDWRWYCWLSQQRQPAVHVHFNSCIFFSFLDFMVSKRYQSYKGLPLYLKQKVFKSFLWKLTAQLTFKKWCISLHATWCVHVCMMYTVSSTKCMQLDRNFAEVDPKYIDIGWTFRGSQNTNCHLGEIIRKAKFHFHRKQLQWFYKLSNF